MDDIRLKLTSRIIKATPRPFQMLLKRLGFRRVLHLFMSKSEGEMIFQTFWAGKFKNKDTQDKVLELWRKYRYLDKIKEICRFRRDTKVLDVGCGISTVLHYVEGERYGIDPLADEYLKLYKYPKGIEVQKAVGEGLPFPSDYFDVAFCSNVLDHTDEPAKVVGEISRVLKEGGYFILVVDVFPPGFKREDDPAHPHTLSKEDTLSLVRQDFQAVFEKVSLSFGEAAYAVYGGREEDKKEELVLILRRRKKSKR